MIINYFWIFLTLALICLLVSELIQVWRQKKYITLLSESTGIARSLNNLEVEEKILNSGIQALKQQIEGFGVDYLVTYNSLLDEMSDQLEGQPISEKIKHLRKDIKLKIKDGSAVVSSIKESSDRKRATHLVLDAFNCKVETSLAKLKSTNVGHIIAEINNSFDIVNMNAVGLQTYIDKSYLKMRVDEAKFGSMLHELRERQKEEQRALREEMREEERVNNERERLAREIELESNTKAEMLRAAQEAANNASEAERAIFKERVRQLEAEVDAVKAKAQKFSMAQMTKVGHVYIISNIGSFGEGILKIGMTRRLQPIDRIDELSSASVPFGFDIHALIPSEDAPRLENELHTYFNDRRVNRINLRKEFFQVNISDVKEFLEKRNVKVNFTMLAEAEQFRESQRLRNMPVEQKLEL